jgi:flagellar biosynthetic protein FliP
MDEWLRTLGGTGPESIAVPVRVLILITLFSVVPSIVLLTTCFPRLFIVLGFLRRALGTQDLPPNQVVAGLAMILTVMVMLPVWKRVHREAYVPFLNGELESAEAALEKAAVPVKEFMLAHTFRNDLRLFVDLAANSDAAASAELAGERVESLSFFIVLPAFVLSELKTAFQMGFLLYLPFLVIDFAVSAILISMGMFMLPPVLISLPIKVLVFVLVDGWNLVVTQLLQGFQGVL